MRKQLKVHPSWICHWSRVNGANENGHANQTMVWICEYPYRTMHLAPPTDCDECPIRMHRKIVGDAPKHPAVA